MYTNYDYEVGNEVFIFELFGNDGSREQIDLYLPHLEEGGLAYRVSYNISDQAIDCDTVSVGYFRKMMKDVSNNDRAYLSQETLPQKDLEILRLWSQCKYSAIGGCHEVYDKTIQYLETVIHEINPYSGVNGLFKGEGIFRP
ncbi:MAG: hypothetical protein CMO81_08490 [Waddliaceae bacterium]|nr:hypothetical protein [Waddliaceae bacterium]